MVRSKSSNEKGTSVTATGICPPPSSCKEEQQDSQFKLSFLNLVKSFTVFLVAYRVHILLFPLQHALWLERISKDLLKDLEKSRDIDNLQTATKTQGTMNIKAKVTISHGDSDSSDTTSHFRERC